MDRKVLTDPICREIWSYLDREFYLTHNDDVRTLGVDPVWHYAYFGWREGRDPSPTFSTRKYLARYPDVAGLEINPLKHYAEFGYVEGRQADPSDLMVDEISQPTSHVTDSENAPSVVISDEEDVIISPATAEDLFDERYYLEVYPDVMAAEVDPLLHYLGTGWIESRDPSPTFSTSGYLARYPDVEAANINPLLHFVEFGSAENRLTGPYAGPSGEVEVVNSLLVGEAEPEPEPEPDDIDLAGSDGPEREYLRSVVSLEFNRAWYLARYADVASDGIDPLDHYLDAGWREGRDPNPSFSTTGYLGINEDVQAAGVNPFYHYIVDGRREGRLVKLDLGFRYGVLERSQSIESAVQQVRDERPRLKPTPKAQVEQAFKSWPRSDGRRLFVSASHDDFTRNFGGVQLVLMREASALEAENIDHIHLFPSQWLPVPEFEKADPLTGVLKNGKLIGHFRASTIATALKLGMKPERCDFAVHSLLGHAADGLVSVIQAAGGNDGWFWLHDYASVCAGHNLLRNDVQFCGAPPIESNACSICRYGGLRARQIEAHRILFSKLNLSVVSPSQAALDIWISATGLPYETCRVLNHATFDGKPAAVAHRSEARPLRVGFLGMPLTHKGWPVFRDLAITYTGDERYSFHHLGSYTEDGLPISFDQVEVRPGNLDAMSETVARLELDVALIWSIWPETFCLTAYEAISGGGAVVTHSDSGNVADMVTQSGFGRIMTDETALNQAFADGTIRSIVERRPSLEGRPLFSRMSAELIGSSET